MAIPKFKEGQVDYSGFQTGLEDQEFRQAYKTKYGTDPKWGNLREYKEYTPTVEEPVDTTTYPRTETPKYIAPKAPVIDEEAIRKQEEDAIAEQIRAIEGVYAGEIAKAKQTGGERVKQRTAISTVRGGAGSDFASAQKDVVETANADIITAINQQMAAEIASARSKGGANARAAIKAAYDNAQRKKEMADSYIASEKAKFDEAEKKASVFAQSGSPYASLDPATRALLEKYYGTGAEAVYKKLGEVEENVAEPVDVKEEAKKEQDILSTAQIEQFRRSYGWTPPFGYTEEQLVQYMKDNPDATPEELEAGANGTKKTVVPETTPTKTKTTVTSKPKTSDTYLNEEYLRQNFDEKQLKKMSDKMGTSKWYTPKGMDIARFMEEAMAKIEQARAEGYTDEEILEFLKV